MPCRRVKDSGCQRYRRLARAVQFMLARIRHAMLGFGMGHEIQDQVSLELAKRIAAGLPSHPEWLELAYANLERWSRQNQDAPALLRCYAEWRQLLSRPLAEIIAILIEESDEAQRLRQNSPFAGALKPREVWEIKSRFRYHETRAT